MSTTNQIMGFPQDEREKKIHPRRKAPINPKKKPLQDPKNGGSVPLTKTASKTDTSLQKSIDPSKEQYTSLLDEMVGMGDMVLLDPTTEDSILENLKKRYNAKEIYTYIGPVLVSVNPYQSLDSYTPEHLKDYQRKTFYELPPHIFSLSDNAYHSMKDHNLNQCIIISGESGSGKTEASKLVMQYVAAILSRGEEVEYVKKQLLQSNPVLEAFGNAKTKRNDNSSRFGKYMDIEFDFKGDPVGGIVSKYLLEKSRVVAQGAGEQNFHIFYQLLSGASTDILQMLHLESEFGAYLYLNGSSTAPLRNNHAKEFEVTMEALGDIGFYPDEVGCILELLASILNLGNITFSRGQCSTRGDIESCTLDHNQCVGYASDMLGCSIKLLEECLTMRSVETRTDFVLKPLTVMEAEYARDALSKAIYDRLFTWIVQRINDRIKADKKIKQTVIGVLDIYGFEVFETNGFEQFVINYCNEKLQQVFIELTLVSEQEEYVREGIDWEHIVYFDNAVICDLLEHPTNGMLAYLDEECLRPGRATDETLLRKFDRQCLEHAHYESRSSKHLLGDHSLPHGHFRLSHYAGKVTYDIKLFMDKNKDLLFKDLSKAMYACERALLQELFPEGDLELQSLKRPQTLSHQSRSSIAELVKNLLSKVPHYIRCIKPNDRKRPWFLDESLARHQVAYLGLLENICVRRAGFAYRQDYGQALARYKMLSPKTWPTWKGSPKDGMKEILKVCSISKKDYSYGRSKIFIRKSQTVFELEGRRKQKVVDLVILVQSIYRGWHQWRKFQEMRKAQTVIACHFKCFKLRAWFLDIRDAAIIIQSFYRGMLARRECRLLLYVRGATWAASIVRKWFYGWKARKEYKELLFRHKYESSAVTIQRYFRGWTVRRYLVRVNAAVVIQIYFRHWMVQKHFTDDRAAVVIQKHFRAWQGRQISRFLRAVMTIQRFYRGWKARVDIIELHRERAAPIITRFVRQSLCYRFLQALLHALPSNSLLDTRWPKCSNLFQDVSKKLCLMHHKWRCKIVRKYYIEHPHERRRMSEKSRASSLFKGKKSLYPKTISIPFKSDRLNLRGDERWSKVVAATDEQRIVWADRVQKLNRKDGKDVARVLVVTGNSLVLLEPKNLTMKYRVEMVYIKKISMSSFSDHICVIHIDTFKAMDRSYSKGDFVLRSTNVIEMATKMHAVIHEILSRKLQIVFSNEIQANFKEGDLPCMIHFQHNPRLGSRANSPLCHRKGNLMHITV